jgi:hypothetical protein
LAINLCHYATEDNLSKIAAGYCIEKSTKKKLLLVLEFLFTKYCLTKPQYLTVSNTEEEC